MKAFSCGRRVSRLNMGDENAHREKCRDDRVAVRWHFARGSPKRAADGRPTAGSRRRCGQPRQSRTARTGRDARRAGTERSNFGAEPVSPLGCAADRRPHDNPRCASSETSQTHVHVGNAPASQDAENRATASKTADQTVSFFFKSYSTAPERSGAFFAKRVKRAANAGARATRRSYRRLRSI